MSQRKELREMVDEAERLSALDYHTVRIWRDVAGDGGWLAKISYDDTLIIGGGRTPVEAGLDCMVRWLAALPAGAK